MIYDIYQQIEFTQPNYVDRKYENADFDVKFNGSIYLACVAAR
jgi:hypothetical protein